MGEIVFLGVAPHPPILLPEVGGGESDKVINTFKAMQKFAKKVAGSGAEVLVIISPHGTVFRDGVAINGSETLAGDLKQFRADLEFEYNNDPELLGEIVVQAEKYGITTIELDDGTAMEYGVSIKLDHGVLVPLYFMDKAGIDLPIVSISMGFLPFEELYTFGVAVKKAVGLRNKKVAIIASGDMSHRLTTDAPAGYSPQGAVFDQEIIELLKNKNFKGIINIDRSMAEEAGECGLRTIIMMLGAMDGEEVESEILSYEGPFGVGYLVAAFNSTGNQEESLFEKLLTEHKDKITRHRADESSLVSLARKSLEIFVREGRKILPDVDGIQEFQEKAGVFVSLKKDGELRGCIGTILPTTDNIGLEIVNNAISAGVRDPRFEPVQAEELDRLDYSVDVLKAPEPIDSVDKLDVKRYGVIVRSGRRSGLLLPNLEGISTVEEQVAIARQKAGIGSNEPVQLERFEVIRHY